MLYHKKFNQWCIFLAQYSFLTIRAYSFQALLGTVGGYIGLILGYTVLHIPEFLASLIGLIKTIRNRVVKDSKEPQINIGLMK